LTDDVRNRPYAEIRRDGADGVAGNTLQADTLASDIWETNHVSFDLLASGTAGNRVLVGLVTDGTYVHWIGPPTANITATQRGGYDIEFGGIKPPDTTARRNLSNTATLTGAYVRCACPIKYMPNPSRIQIYDVANIHAAGDTYYWRRWRSQYKV
jgi:hypothetical protein